MEQRVRGKCGRSGPAGLFRRPAGLGLFIEDGDAIEEDAGVHFDVLDALSLDFGRTDIDGLAGADLENQGIHQVDVDVELAHAIASGYRLGRESLESLLWSEVLQISIRNSEVAFPLPSGLSARVRLRLMTIVAIAVEKVAAAADC